MQTICGKATIKDLKTANKVLEFALETSTEGLYYKAGAISWDDAVVATITDASFGNEEEIVNGAVEGGRSQQGYVLCLGPPDLVNLPVADVHIIAWSSTVIRRACRATLQAETMALTKGVEAGTRLRAAIVDMKGKFDIKNWEVSAASNMGHVWMTDCDSLYEHLVSPKLNSIQDKRLGIDLMALRQDVWERGGERTQFIDHSSGDYPRWMDNSTMIADPLTKAMAGEPLLRTLTTGERDLRPTAESLIKERNRRSRKSKKESLEE